MSASSHASTPNTEETFLEIKAPASTTIILTDVLCTFNKGAAPASNTWTVRIKRNSAAGTPTSGTNPSIIKKREDSPASVVVSTEIDAKNGTNAFTVGTNVDTSYIESASEYSQIHYAPVFPKDFIVTNTPANYIAITGECTGLSRVMTIGATWDE